MIAVGAQKPKTKGNAIASADNSPAPQQMTNGSFNPRTAQVSSSRTQCPQSFEDIENCRDSPAFGRQLIAARGRNQKSVLCHRPQPLFDQIAGHKLLLQNRKL